MDASETKRDWSVYNSHRQKEMSRFIRESKRVLEAVGPPTTPRPEDVAFRGRPPYHPASMLLANLLRIYLKMSYRDLEAMLRDNEQMRRRLGLRDAPGRDTVHRYAKTLSEDYLAQFNAQLTTRLKKTGSESASTLRVSRSSSTQSVGTLPRTRLEPENS